MLNVRRPVSSGEVAELGKTRRTGSRLDGAAASITRRLAALEAIGSRGRADPGLNFGLSSPFGGDSSVREGDLDAATAEVDHRDQCGGGLEAVCAV